MSFNLFMHHIVFVLYFFVLNCSLPLVLFLLFFPFFFFCALVPYSSTMPRKTRANRVPSTPVVSPSKAQLFRNERALRPMRNLIVNVRFGLNVL